MPEIAEHSFHFTLEQAKNSPITPGLRSVQVFSHGTCKVRYYAPQGVDAQTPHEQDEIYVVASGSGWFQNGDDRHPFQTGDVIFAPAGRDHRFVDFSDDFATWVVFYGPSGGEESNG